MIDKYSTKRAAVREHSKMQDVLMDLSAEGPEVHYWMTRGSVEWTNITIWNVGKVGEEYIKTYGHYHIGDLDETYTFLQGKGIVLLQKRAIGEDGKYIDDEIEEAYAIDAKPGDEIFIPSEWGHLVVNTGNIFLVTSDDSPVNFEEVDPVSLPGHADYEAVKRMQGFCYYIVERDGKPALVKNEKYKKIPDLEIIEASAYPLHK
ncbi:MAG: glucose-6-phosphate isomerase family protein [Candidatus Curtissbacteria bacterium]|nr:glucose-6-phosphate isomerase family protein [Candidatus Curtissbacteria bacterium]